MIHNQPNEDVACEERNLDHFLGGRSTASKAFCSHAIEPQPWWYR
jgi:hypothetical protein